MTRDEKLQFIGDLMATVKAAIVERVDDMPDEWDGHELRRYLADKLEEQIFHPFSKHPVWGFERDKRLRAYHNECIARNL